MVKGIWVAGCVGIGLLIGCGVQSVDYPAGNDAGAGGTACTTDAQCKGFCANGTCQNCTASTQCKDPAKPVCDVASGACGNGAATGGCTSSSQCAAGQACIAGVCGACTSNDQCAAGLVCKSGACGPCASNTECAPGLQCTNGACTSPGGDSGPTIDAGCTSGYVGVVGPVGSVWGAAAPGGFGAAAGGATGKQAGDNACNGAFAGAHACTWEEVKASDACGKLVALKGVNDSAWMHRSAAETMVGAAVDDNPGGAPGAAAKGARCNDWTYPTNHAFDGEFIQFGGGTMVGHFDSDTADDNGATSTHAASGVLECNGMSRKVLCCK